MLAQELFIEEKLSMVYGRMRLKIKGNVLTQLMVYTLILILSEFVLNLLLC